MHPDDSGRAGSRRRPGTVTPQGRSPRVRRLLTGSALALLACAAATRDTQGQEEGGQARGTVLLKPCAAPDSIAALCGVVTVPEDPSRPDGPAVDLAVTVLPATGDTLDPDPVFPLHGGPGAAARFLVPLFASSPLRAGRDFVFVDQRGTGASNGLHCEPDALDRLMDVVLRFAMPPDCARIEADLGRYGTSQAMDDLDVVRAAMGYDRINLWGGSYGSRAALEYLRRHPDRVRTALLDGVAPPEMYIPLYFPPGAEAALGLVLEDCRADAGCAARFPDTRSALTRALERLEAAPETVPVRDPRSGEAVPVRFGREQLAGAVLYALYNVQTAAQLPRWIHDAGEGNLVPIANFAAAFSLGIGRQFAFGMTAAVTCPEDAARYGPSDVARQAEGSFLGETLGRNLLDLCEAWPPGRVPPEFWTPVRSEAPVLVLSGQADPVTPPLWADRVLRHLPNGRHAVFPDNGHGATGSPCGNRLFQDLVTSGSAEGLDLGCAALNRRPAWGGVDPEVRGSAPSPAPPPGSGP